MSGLNNNRIDPHGRTTKEYWNRIPLDGSNLLGLGFWGGIFVFSPGVIKSKETARSSDWPVYVFIQPLDGNFAIGGPGPQSIPEIPDMWCIFKVRVHHSLKTHTHTCRIAGQRVTHFISNVNIYVYYNDDCWWLMEKFILNW